MASITRGAGSTSTRREFDLKFPCAENLIALPQSLLLLVNETADSVRLEQLRERGVEIQPVKPAEQGRRLHLLEAWRSLGARGVRRVLVEGGGGLLSQLLGWDCVDQVHAYVAPKMVGGRFAPTPVGGAGRAFMAEAWRFGEMRGEPVGEDLLLTAFRTPDTA